MPAFAPEQAENLIDQFSKPVALTPELTSIEVAWKSTVQSRIGLQGADQALAMLAEQLRAGTHVNQSFLAAFSYPWVEKFTHLEANTLVLATQSSLLEPTRTSARLIPNHKLVERLDIERSVLDPAAEKTASELLVHFEGLR